MSGDLIPQWRPEPEPQNELERLLPKAAKDPALQGKMFRLLWESELFIFVPDHPEIHGEYEIKNGDEFAFTLYGDPAERFAAVFTSDAAADYASTKAPGPTPAVAALPGEVLFKILCNGKNSVRVNYGLRSTIKLDPEGVAALVRGDFTHRRPRGGQTVRLTLHHVPAEEMPPKLCKAIRVFCAQRPGAVGVYVFNPVNQETGAADSGDLRILVWLRDPESDFYNDFTIMVEKLLPDYLRANFWGITPDDTQAIAFLEGRTPLWPIVKFTD